MEPALRIDDVIEKELYVDRHGISHPNKRDGKSIYFLNRIEDLFLDVIREHYISYVDKDLFLEYYAPINDYILALPRELSKDSFRKNWICNRDGRLVAIDFGTLRLFPPQFELANILEGCMDNLSDRDIHGLIGAYVKNSEELGYKRGDEILFMEGYYSCAAQRHLELVGYNELGYLDPPQKAPHRKTESVWQIQKARKRLEELSKSRIELEPSQRILDSYLTSLEEVILS